MTNIATTNASIYRILAEHLCLPESDIKPDSSLESLGADSLDVIEIVLNIEDSEGVQITDAEFGAYKTVGQVIELVEGLKS